MKKLAVPRIPISYSRQLVNWTLKAVLLLAAVILVMPDTARALSAEQKRLFQSGVYQFDVEVAAGSNCSPTDTLTGAKNEEKIWNFFAGKGLKPVAVAGIMGNFIQESSTYDPAGKQDGTLKAIPDQGDGKTGFGIAQWTSQNRQALLFAQIRAAGLQQYYGANWGNSEVNKDIPAADIEKLLTIELNFAWSGDTTKVQDIAGQLNSAPSVEGNNGSTILFHKLYERSADDASQIKERITSAATILQKYGGTGVLASGSCSTGQLGGVSAMEDVLPWAKRFVSDTAKKYDSPLAQATLLGDVPSDGGSVITVAEWPESTSFVCWGAWGCDECTTLSGWFVTAMTGYTYGGGNGGDVVMGGNGRPGLAGMGVPTGTEPKPFSVFSTRALGGDVGHTGIVMGILANGEIITLENNNGARLLKVIRYKNLKESYPDIKFAYVGDKLKVNGIPGAGQ